MTDWNHAAAQTYEMEYSVLWIDESYSSFFEKVQELRRAGKVEPVYLAQFFQNKVELWDDFVKHVKKKSNLEISSGPAGIFPLISHWLSGDLNVIIDPLIKEYDKYITEKHGKTWFDHTKLTLLDVCIEEYQSYLKGKITGFILFRNGLDHLSDPYKAIQNLANYAAFGCRLLFWADLVHVEPPDAGHHTVAEPAVVKQWFVDAGFEIQYETEPLRDHNKLIDWGCVGVRR